MSEWQPIETAPDAGFIIGAWPEGSRWRSTQLFNEYGEWVCVFSDYIYSPTHWMPLPPLQNSKGTGKQFGKTGAK